MLRAFLLLCAFALAAAGAERRPNIIFILADDLGYGEIGCFGQKLIATPNLDRMAADGMKFTRFYAGSPVCAPSRSVLMTGRHTGHTRVRGNAARANRKAQDLQKEDTTIAEVLKGAGYATALIGKWGIGHEGSDGVPNKKGFDFFYGYLDQLHAHNCYPEFVMRNAERVALRNKTIPGTEGKDNTKDNGAGIAGEPLDFVPDLMTAEALRWVAEKKEQPFFLFWSLVTPHANNEGTKHGRGQEIPDLGPYADKPWPKPDKAHAATITRLDADIGRLLELLKKLGIDENTLVMFSSDNGHHKEAGNDPELFDANGPLNGLKRNLTEGGIRVPTIARWPGTVKAGSENSATWWFADVFRTFSDLAGIEFRRVDDGVSFAGLLRGNWTKPDTLRTLYWEFHEGGYSQAVIMDERWKAIRLKRLDAPLRIFDLQDDLGESRDLAGERPDLVERAKKLFVSEHTDSSDWPIKEAKPQEAKPDNAKPQ